MLYREYNIIRDLTLNDQKNISQIINEIVEQGILDAVGDAVSIQDTDFKVLYQNEKAKKMIGDHVGKYCYREFEKKEKVCEDCPLELSLNDGMVRTVVRHNPAVKELVVEITTSAVKDCEGKIIAGIEIVRDITERKRLENLIIQAKKDWEETFDTINEAITIHDNDFNIIRANRAAAKVLGIQFPAIFNQKCYTSYHGLESPPHHCPSCRTLITGEHCVAEVFEPNLNKYLEVKAYPRFDRDNNITGVVHVVRDITERKEMEENREKLILELKKALAKVKTLKGLLPICASCSKIRDDKGSWTHVDVYIRNHSEAEFTHSYCPECAERHFPENYRNND